jgi:hypothetical protein
MYSILCSFADIDCFSRLSKVSTRTIHVCFFWPLKSNTMSCYVGSALLTHCIYTLNTLFSRQINHGFTSCRNIPSNVPCLFFWPSKFKVDVEHVGPAFLTNGIYILNTMFPAKIDSIFSAVKKNTEIPPCLFFCLLSILSPRNEFEIAGR